jgi:serine kinase of HPr protein (carbohydrate metabolism regulator)
VAELYVEFDGEQVVLETEIPEVEKFIRVTFAHMLVGSAPRCAGRIGVTAGPLGYTVAATHADDVTDEWLEMMLGVVQDEVRNQFMRARSDLLWLHSGAVEKDGYARLICGPSGRGKSTLTTMLCERGWRLMSDDVVPIRMDTDMAMPFPQSAQRRLQQSSVLSNRELNGVKKERIHFDRESVRDVATPIRDFFFPVFGNDLESLSRLSSATAAMEILGSSMNFRDHRANAVARAAKLAETVASYRIVYRNASAAADAINNFWN